MLSNNQNLNNIKTILDSHKPAECPLHICMQNDTSEYLHCTVNNINTKDQYLRTPLHTATLYRRLDIVLWLLKNGANPQLQNTVRDTPLHIAAALDITGLIVQNLLNNQVTLQLQNIAGNTPLHVAIFSQNFMAIEHFFNYHEGKEIFLNITNNNGETPLDLAKKNQNILDFINKKRKNIANNMVKYEFSINKFKHFINNVGIDINNTLLADGSLILTSLIRYCNTRNIQSSTFHQKLASIKYSIACGARVFKMDGNGKSMMSILVDITNNHRQRSLCNTLEAYKDKLCIQEEKSCIDTIPDNFVKEQMNLLLFAWKSGFNLYQCIKEIFVNMAVLNLTNKKRNTNTHLSEGNTQAPTTQLVLQDQQLQNQPNDMSYNMQTDEYLSGGNTQAPTTQLALQNWQLQNQSNGMSYRTQISNIYIQSSTSNVYNAR